MADKHKNDSSTYVIYRPSVDSLDPDLPPLKTSENKYLTVPEIPGLGGSINKSRAVSNFATKRLEDDIEVASVEKELACAMESDSAGHYGYEKDFRTALPQIIATCIKNLLLLAYGMTLGFPTILIPAVQHPREGEILNLSNSEISWIGLMRYQISNSKKKKRTCWVRKWIERENALGSSKNLCLQLRSEDIGSINLIVVPLGCALSGIVTTPIGRRRSMQLVNLPFLLAWLLLSFSTGTEYLYAALFLTGLSGGLLEAPVLTYVAEITQPHLRGALSATTSMAVITGVFTQFLLGLFLYWRTVALVNISFTVLTVIALFFIPESPHWLVSRKRFDEAKKSLEWLRGWKKSLAVARELEDIKKLYEKPSSEKMLSGVELYNTLWSQVCCYFEKSFIVPFFLVSYAFFVGHFSGMTTLQTYAVSIFQMLEAPLDKYYATLVLGVVQILGSGICVLLVHYTGKRPLAFLSTAGGGVCCVLVALYDAYCKTSKSMYQVGIPGDTNNSISSNEEIALANPYSWIPTTSLLLLALLTHVGIRLLPWILIGEVFSARTRSGGAGLASAVGYIFGFLANKLYISMVDYMDILGTYGFYGLVCFTGCMTFYFILPETEGKKLSDIETHFAGGKRLTNQVYRSQKNKVLVPVELTSYRGLDLDGLVNLSFERD